MIKVENLGKKYVIGHKRSAGTGHDTIKDRIVHVGKGIYQRLRHPLSPNRETTELEEIWALKDVNFEIKQGERVGIIGRNGAGKSTLLKVLSRITEPTTGSVTMNGRVASLLEVGTGFHPELSGRENIFLNGAVLGMSRVEIKKKFDEIVDFSGVEKFIDTPVKRYSSGMKVRLGFAVAAHLEPEILLVDEVLAVGDIEFQKKCLGKMEDISTNQGRTVLFVSHNMSTISSLCPQCIFFSNGRIAEHGNTANIIHSYYKSVNSASPFCERCDNGKPKPGDSVVELISGYISSDKGEKLKHPLDEPINIGIIYKIKKQIDNYIVPNFHIYTEHGVCVSVIQPFHLNRNMETGKYEAAVVIPANLLNAGVYSVDIAVTTFDNSGYKVNLHEKGYLSFFVVENSRRERDYYGYKGGIPGVIRPKLKWNIRKLG